MEPSSAQRVPRKIVSVYGMRYLPRSILLPARTLNEIDIDIFSILFHRKVETSEESLHAGTPVGELSWHFLYIDKAGINHLQESSGKCESIRKREAN